MDASPPEPEGSGPDPDHRMPGWVRAFVIVAIVVAVVAVVGLVVAGDGGHGPQRHGLGGGAEVQASQSRQPPAGLDH